MKILTLGALAATLLASTSVLAAVPDPRLSTDGSDPSTWNQSLDGVIAAPKNHNVIYKDEGIRVVRVTIPPGTIEPLHMHRYCSILVFDQLPKKIKDFDANGKENTRDKTFPPYNHIANPFVVAQQPNAPHYFKNDDTVAIQLVRIEFLKEKGPCSWDAPDLVKGKVSDLK